jgi:hypothetical protein
MRSRVRRKCYYDARANDVNLREITSSEKNANILRALRAGWNYRRQINLFVEVIDQEEDNCLNFFIRDGDDLGWLGYFIGRSEYLETLGIENLPEDTERIDALIEGIVRNKSIQNLFIGPTPLQDFIDPVAQFIRNIENLATVAFCVNNIGRQQAQKIAPALRQMHKPIKEIYFLRSNISEGALEDMCGELSSLPQIEILDFCGSNIGRNDCLTLGNMLSSWYIPMLKSLVLDNNSVDDRGLQALVGGMVNCCNLEVVQLSGNRSITAAGLRSLSTLFQSRSCSLKRLWLKEMNIGDDGSAALAEGLVGNKSLERIHFDVNVAGITEVGWSAFSKLLCDTSSINNTYISNHTLRWIGQLDDHGAPKDVVKYLTWNTDNNEHDVAIWKILRHHRELDIEPLFQWKLDFLPLLVTWFERARFSIAPEYLEKRIEIMNLSTVHQFVRGMPMLIIDGYNSRRTSTRLSRKRRLDGEIK